MFRRRFLALLALPLVLAACDRGLGPGFDGNVTGPPESIDFASSLNIDLARMTRQASGLYIENLVVGSGALAVDSGSVVVRYTGWLPNGRRFDTGQINAVLAGGSLVDGFTEGVLGMRVGGRRKIVIPPALGYGNSGQGVIPANATLVFDIELLAAAPPAPATGN